ncbi:hypothetical protein [uncultured Alistipes sp.]|uniref:hypothetical protein n=1 Tax=uncultured Alistipes sp. TaxID=538949 RepID=UPI0025E74D35|nr:hypothetical protein [uncultured Alistipes sp.]
MRNYYILGIWACVLLAAAGLYGCVRDSASGYDGETVDMQLALDTYAASADPNASANEAAVKSAWVYIFNEHGVLENPGKTAVPLNTSGEAVDAAGRLNHTWRVVVGRKDIYVLLNAGVLTRDGAAIDLSAYTPYSKTELETLMTDPANFAADFPAAGSAGMLMSGKLSANVSTAALVATVPVARRYARIDFNLRRKADLAGAAVVVRSVTLENRRETARAFAPAVEHTGADAVCLNDHDDVIIGAGTTEYTAVTSFYTMPRTGAARAACLKVTVGIDGKDYTLPVYINSGALGGNTANDEELPLDIAANKVYKVDVTLGKQACTVSMDILDWNEAVVGGDIHGSSLVVDSLVRVNAGASTLIPVRSKAAKVVAKLSDAAVAAGYSLNGAGPLTGVLELDVVDGRAEIPVTGPVAYPVGEEYTMAVVAGNIRRNVLLRVDGTPVLEVGDEIVEFLYSGETKPYRVTSYVELGDDAGTKVPVAWTAEFSVDEGKTWTTSKPAWLAQFTDTDTGSTAPASFYAQVAAATGVVTSASREALLAAAPESDLDLSMTKGLRNTANCYVVNASGTYTLPLVYGNALRDGDPNTEAYTSTKSGTDVLTRFVNHLGDAIREPYIYDNPGCTPANACLVWQDAEGLVRNVALTDDLENISFEVPRETIRQGNAIVAVRDAAGTIMWSWHIWVTDYVLDSDVRTVTNSYSVGYDFMPVNLGWCDGPTTVYENRRVSVRLTQAGTGQTALFTLDQPAATVADPGNNTYYQWGRKDPMLPGIFEAGSYFAADKSCHTDSDKPGYAFNSSDLYSSDIGEWIKAPYCFNTHDYMDMKYFNLWNADNTAADVNNDTVVKTVYDPSPVGYCLPPVNAFTGTTAYGSMASGDSAYGYMFNSPYTSSADYDANNGWVFYCNRMTGIGSYDPDGGTIYFPAMGFRGSSGVFGSGSGRYWTGTATSTDNSGNFSFGSSQIDPRIDANRYSGMPVRPIREQ